MTRHKSSKHGKSDTSKEINFFFQKEFDLELIQEPYRAAYHSKLPPFYWEWRFRNNPNHGKIYIGYILKQGRLASYYAISPMTISLSDGRRYTAGHINMIMTHPDFQGKGYNKSIAFRLHEKIQADGFIGLYSFPVRSITLRYFKKYFDWRNLFTLHMMTITREDVRPGETEKANRLHYVIGEVDNRILSVVEEFKYGDNNLIISRDRRHLKWRLLDIPIRQYHYLTISENSVDKGILFFKYYGPSIDIMEYGYNPLCGDERERIFNHGILHLLHCGGRPLNIWSSDLFKGHMNLKRLGFVESGEKTHFGVIPFGDLKEFQTPSCWHLSLMDSDVY